MVLGKVKRLFKKAITITLTAAMVVTSVPQLSVSTSAQELGQDTEEIVVETEESVVEEAETETEGEESTTVETAEPEEGETESAGETETNDLEETEEETTTVEESSETVEETVETVEETMETVSEEETETEELETIEEPVDDAADETNMAMRYVVEAVPASADNTFVNCINYENISGFSDAAVSTKYTLSYDLYIPKDASFTGSYYAKAAMQMKNTESDWNCVYASAGSNISSGDFETDTASGLKKYSFTGEITIDGTFTGVNTAVIAIGSSECSYEGAIFVDNVSIKDADSKETTQDFTGYSGAVELGDMTGVESGEEEEDEPATDNSKVVYENDFDDAESTTSLTIAELADGNKAVKYTKDLSSSSGWTTIFEEQFCLSSAYEEEITEKVNMSYDVYLPESVVDSMTADDFGTMKGKATVEVGSGWTWVNDTEYPEFKLADLEDDEAVPGYKKFHVSIDMDDLVTWDSNKGANVEWPFEDITPIQAVRPTFAGDISHYNGEVYLDNLVVTAYNKTSTDIPEVEDDVVLSLDADAWTPLETGWQYPENGVSVSNKTVGGKEVLAVSLDYTGYDTKDWSEAKVDYAHPTTVASMNGYNTFKADLYYNPSLRTKGSFKVKLTCDELGVAKDVEVPEGTAVDDMDGWYKSEVTVSFNTKDASFSKLTLGIVGYMTDYKGDVYLDNARFTQVTADDIYVDATVVAKKGNGITVAEDGRSITTASGQKTAIADKVALVDAEAMDATKNLYAYIKAVGESDSVIFGHQNDTHKKSGATGDGFTNSDTKDVTGSIAGVVGLDTLSLTGDEASEWDTPEADRIANLANITKEAAAEGAIITMSAHMPNFDVIDKRVKAFEEGGKTATANDTLGYWEVDGEKQYNFSGYTPNVVTGDVVSRIMPGKDLNYLYTDYLDLIADYAKAVEGDGVTILFRPLHECTGSWFWWGAAQCDEQAYINLYRYTVTYLKETKDVHNMIYVYGPGSEAENVDEYAARYPGDDYVDMIGYDMYHSTPTQENEATYLANIRKQNAILKAFAAEHNKIYAVTETGIANGSYGVLPSGNEVKDWYTQLLDTICEDGGVSYVLLWANFNDSTHIYIPFVTEKKEDGILHGHEMLDDFINFYNDERSVFASDMNNGYKNVKGVTNTTQATKATGYILAPLSGARVLEETTLQAKVSGVDKTADVKFEIATDVDGTTIKATYNAEEDIWEAVLTENELSSLGEEVGTIKLVVNKEELAVINAKFNMPEVEANPLVPDDFESYNGNDVLLNGTWATNKATGCSIALSLTEEANKVYGGSYAMQMDIQFSDANGWAGATKSLDVDWSEGNALELYTMPESFAQKVVVQLISNGEEFEVYLQENEDYAACGKGEVPVKVTIPFDCFVLRDDVAVEFSAEKIEGIGLWCNAIGSDDVTFPLTTSISYDEIKVVTTDKTEVTVEPLGTIAKEGMWMEEIPAYEYTGSAIKPEVKVYDGKKQLTLNKDYTVIYKDNVNAGEAIVTVKGKGNYTEIITTGFTITPKSIMDLDVELKSVLPYNKKAQKIALKVKDGSRVLKEGKDYTKMAFLMKNGILIPVTNAKEVGQYQVWIFGGTSGNYVADQAENFRVETFEVKEVISLEKATVKLPSASLAYNDGKEVEFPNASKITVTVNKKVVPAKNYTISYENNTEPGKAYVVITAVEDSGYVGSVKKAFTVKGVDFKEKNIKIEGFASSKNYTGNKVYQSVTLWDKAALSKAKTDAEKQAAKLQKNVDYKIEYKNNTNAGKATVTITGLGKYSGKITKTFSIKKVKLTASMVKTTSLSVEQNKAGATPDIRITYNGKTLVNGVDYTLSYGNNKKVTTARSKATITVKGKGNFQGTLKNVVKFDITAKALSSEDITIEVPDVKFNKNTKAYTPNPVVYDNGKKLVKNTDYTVSYSNNTKAVVGTVDGKNKVEHIATVTITAKKGGSYYTGDAEKDTVTATFRIVSKMMKDTTVVVKDQDYVKEGAMPTKADIEVTYGKGKKAVSVTADEYEIVSITKNNKAGKGTIVLQGKGQYGGTKTATFKIKARSISSITENMLVNAIK